MVSDSRAEATVLVAHADTGVRERIRRDLASRGFSVLTASPEEAQYLAESEGVDVVLTETPLPELSGDVDGAAWVCLGCSADGVDDSVPADADMDVLADRIRLHVAYRRRWSAHRQVESRKTRSLTAAQQRLLPRPGEVPGVRFGVVYAPALEAGGDFYDVIPLAHGSFGVLVADTVGHDLGASYVTGSLKSLTALSVSRDAHPTSVLEVLNEGLRPVLGGGRYVTALFARVDVVRGVLTLASAGHPSPLWVPLGGSPRFLEAQGDVLGVYPRIDTPEIRVPAPPGSRLYAFSDGLLEAVAQSVGERPRVAGILEAVAEEVRPYPVELAVAEIASRLVGEGRGQADDIVLLGVEV